MLGIFFFVWKLFQVRKKFLTKKISHQRKKNSDQKNNFFACLPNFFFSCLNFLIQVKIEALFLLGFLFCLEIILGKKKNFSPKKISHQKKNSDQKQIFFWLFYKSSFFLSKILLIQVKIEVLFLYFL